MFKGNKIRSDLPANRESRRSVRANIQKSAFGVYHNLSEESAETVRKNLILALKDVKTRMINEGLEVPQLIIPEAHAVTYLERRDVVKAMQNGSLKNLEVGRLISKVDDYNLLNSEGVDIEISGFKWAGGNERKFAGSFSIGAYQEFVKQTEVIDDMFHFAGAAVLEASEPDHVSLCTYRVPRNMGLAAQHREIIDEIVSKQFDASDIGTVTLSTLVAGPSYTQSMEIAA